MSEKLDPPIASFGKKIIELLGPAVEGCLDTLGLGLSTGVDDVKFNGFGSLYVGRCDETGGLDILGPALEEHKDAAANSKVVAAVTGFDLLNICHGVETGDFDMLDSDSDKDVDGNDAAVFSFE